MSTLTHLAKSKPLLPSLSQTARTDLLRTALILMLFVNVALTVTLAAPAPRAPSATLTDLWHGNASGAELK